MAPRLLTCFGRGSGDRAHQNTTGDVAAEEQNRGGAVVVELFTSQGCGVSPEAEVGVSRLGRGDFAVGVPVVVLAFHVDYWDYNGWKDPFASSQWTVRQKSYVEALKLDTMFTPQIVVHGATHCVGTDQEAVLAAISAAPRFPAPTFQAKFRRPTTDCLQVTLTGALRAKVDSEGANVMVAFYQSGVITDCPAGDNKGQVLANDYIVRKLEKLCTVKDISPKMAVSGTLTFTLWEGFNSSKCGLAVFVQGPSHHIFGAQNLCLPDNI